MAVETRGPAPLTPRDLLEYQELRATIRQRGSLRLALAGLGFTAWGALVVALAASSLTGWATLVPLIALAALFEAILALHVGVERVGRYLQVFFEEEPLQTGGARRDWEHQAMQYGSRFRGGIGHPLFPLCFASAIPLNLLPAVLAGHRGLPLVVLALMHIVVLVRIVFAHRHTRDLRARDLERFRALRDSGPHS